MHYLTDPLQYVFIQRAIVAAVIIGVLCAALGTFVVLRRMAVVGHALTHSALPGLVIAYLMGGSLFAGALIATVLTALGIGFLARDENVYEDTLVGMIPNIMFAFGILLISTTRSFRERALTEIYLKPKWHSTAQRLKEKLRVVLWQFPPDFKCAPERLETFLALLDNYGVRSALEFRNQSWLCDEVVALCKARNVALCMADRPAFLEAPPLTADFVYLRRHGAEGNYLGEYSREQVAKDAGRIRNYLAKKRDVFIYYNNDAGGAAPRNAQELAELLPKPHRGGKQ